MSDSKVTPITHVFIDVETLGLRADCCVLSLGAIIWRPDHERPQGWYAEFDWDRQYKDGRTVTASTLNWWLTEANIKPPVCGNIPIETGLAQFFATIQDTPEPRLIWANGTDFDISILKSLSEYTHQPLPWEYRDVRDIRTISKLFGINPERDGVRHNALDDAKWSMQVVQELMKRFPELVGEKL